MERWRAEPEIRLIRGLPFAGGGGGGPTTGIQPIIKARQHSTDQQRLDDDSTSSFASADLFLWMIITSV